MSWRYAEYRDHREFAALPFAVNQAARAALEESFPRLRVSNTTDGLLAQGVSGWHNAFARFLIEPIGAGSKVSVTLSVERLGPLGIVGFDAFGYYDGQIRKWLDGISWHLNHEGDSAAAQRDEVVAQQNKRAGALLVGCPMAVLLLIAIIYCIAAIVGVLTGSLYLAARGSGGVTIHGPWARIVSVGILMFIAALVIKVRRALRPGGIKGFKSRTSA